MNKERLITFGDGVIAIIITIMVLALKFGAIHRDTHHHLSRTRKRVNGSGFRSRQAHGTCPDDLFWRAALSDQVWPPDRMTL